MTIELNEAQIKREEEHRAEATAAYIRNLTEALSDGRLDDIPAADRIVARLFEDVRAALEVIVTSQARGAGAAHKGWLRKVPLDTLTVLSMRTVMSMALQDSRKTPATMQRIAHRLGMAIVQEAQIQDVHKVNPQYLDRTWNYLRSAGTNSPGHIRKTMRAVVRNVLDEVYEGHLPNSDYMHIGKWGLDACCQVGLVEIVRTGESAHSGVVYHIPEQLYKSLGNVPPFGLSGISQHMIAPPLPWTSSTSGGYYMPRTQQEFPLLRVTQRSRKVVRKLVRQSVENSPAVLECATYLQDQAFALHKPTTELIRRVWDQGGGVLGIPRKEMTPAPESPFPIGWDSKSASTEDSEKMQKWKRQMHAWYSAHKDLRKAQQVIGALLLTSNSFEDTVWLPTFIDRRGRYYYRGKLNPQGDERSKAVLHFAEKKPLGERGVYWLRVHIANCFGYDKGRMDARAQWTINNWDALVAGLAAPEDSDLYRSNNDAPLCAFAAVYELQAALATQNPASYCTGIPIHMDATCSGLQHFSALLRDPVGGHYVNLLETTTETKADIYRKVADLAKARIAREAAGMGKEQALAQAWASVDIPRDLAKKPVMTYVYGATLRGVAEFCADFIDEHHVPVPEGTTVFSMGFYMARVLFDAIEDTVPAAAACMRWLRKRAQQHGQNGPMVWKSPTGLLVEHDYRDYAEKRVDIRSCGLTKIVVREQLDTIRPTSMQNAVAPNFVHGLDAAHLTFTAQRMQAHGAAMVAIHDSFGTHPSDVDFMHVAIREAFVELYEQHDPLDLLLKGIGQQDAEQPMRGTLDLRAFLKSEFGFS